MKKILNVSLYIIIILLIAVINVVSIKKFFAGKKRNALDDIIAINYVTNFVSTNSIEIIESTDEVNSDSALFVDEVGEEKPIVSDEVVLEEVKEEEEVLDQVIEEVIEPALDSSILYDGLTEEELIAKLEKSLKNELSGTGISFVTYYKTTGLDPYLAVAIVLHETGCTWNCSNLVKECYNYGGMKGGENKYKDTGYACYSSKEEGIKAYLNMLYNNYYSKGLTTAELINPKYASSLEWAVKINNYIDKIKNS